MNSSMNPIRFMTRTRRAGRIDITDILSWVWLIGGTLAVLVPVLWAGLSSLKPAAEITRFRRRCFRAPPWSRPFPA